MRRVFHCVQVIQVAEELVEAVNGRQEFVKITQMVFAKLTSGVALRFKSGGNGASLGRKTRLGPSLTYCRHSGANWQLASDKVRAPGGTARFGVIIGEEHAF